MDRIFRREWRENRDYYYNEQTIQSDGNKTIKQYSKIIRLRTKDQLQIKWKQQAQDWLTKQQNEQAIQRVSKNLIKQCTKIIRLSTKDQLKIKWKQQKYDIQQQKFQEKEQKYYYTESQQESSWPNQNQQRKRYYQSQQSPQRQSSSINSQNCSCICDEQPFQSYSVCSQSQINQSQSVSMIEQNQSQVQVISISSESDPEVSESEQLPSYQEDDQFSPPISYSFTFQDFIYQYLFFGNQSVYSQQLSQETFKEYFENNQNIKKVQLNLERVQKFNKCSICYEEFVVNKEKDQVVEGDFQKQKEEIECIGQKEKPGSEEVEVKSINQSFVDQNQDIDTNQQKQKQEEGVIQLSCSHIFHTNCIKNWLKQKFTCPLCRQNFREPTSIQDNQQI